MNRLVLISLLFFTACNSQPNSSATAEVAKDSIKNFKQINKPFLIDGCYISVLKKDTAFLKIDNANGQVMGNLVYNHFEKDDNTGTINGKIQDSLIIAYYTFQSEGMTSVREVVFKISGEKLIEVYGNIDMKGDTAHFKNIGQIKFQEEQTFVKEACR
ncbi:MAG: hypothetical protein ABIR03_13455 [Ginsengibacter sp.]